MRSTSILCVGILCAVFALGGCGGGGGEDPVAPILLPVNGTHYGHTYQELAGAWWAWAMSVPYDVNPINDPDGQNADLNQPTDLWFLAGTGGTTAERYVWVPAGRPLFFPIMNTIWITFPGIDPPFSQPGAEQAARDAIAMTGNEILTLEVDGVQVGDLLAYRAMSPVFSVTAPEWNWFDGPNPTPPGVLAAGTYPECVADGYWAYMDPLPPGIHTIRFTADSTTGFTLDVTFHIAVE